MAFLKVSNVAIRGISACVPPYVEENREIPFYTAEEAEKVIETTGVERKHIVKDGITASDLCLKAAEKLINELKWERESIDAICYVTQTPDYLNQPTGFVIHDKMNLSADCMVLDLFHGCPGWVVGLNTLSSLMSSGSIKRALLLDGDNVTLEMIALDRESRPLFGDCGTVTALEFDESAPAMYFNHGTNSKDGKALIHNEGGSRNPYTMETVETELKLRSGELSPEDVNVDTMDGMSVFSFGITTPPKSIKKLLEELNIDIDDVDKVVLHQANLFMLKKIIKKLKIDSSKAPSCLKEYGNTTSTSIPLTIVSQCKNDYEHNKLKSVVCGFGTGLSWATAYFETNDLIIPEVIIY